MKYLILVLALLTGCASTAEKQARQDRADALTEWREWAEDFPESERECHAELAKVRALAEQQRRQLVELGAELATVRAEVIRLSRQVHGEEPL